MEEYSGQPSSQDPAPEFDVKEHPEVEEGGCHDEEVIVTSTPSNFDITSAEARQIQELTGRSFDLGNEESVVDALFDISGDSISRSPLTAPPCNSTEESANSEWWTDTPSCPVRIRFGDSGAAAEPTETVIEMFERVTAAYGEHPALAVKRHGEWKEWTYRKYYDDCFIAAKALIELGLKPHHSVCILGFNAPEWSITNLATIMAGGLATGLYLTSSPEACFSIASDSKANVIVVENDSQLQKILQIRDKLPHLKAIVQYTREVTERDDNVWDWKQFFQLGQRTPDTKLKARLSQLASNMCCSLIYTSGTTGQPKGVMLSHDNLTWMCRRVMCEASCDIGQERFVSYLPLSHVASQLLDIYTSLASAGTCWFAQPDALKGSLVQTMKEIQPTMFLGVPRVYEKIAESMQMVARNTTGLKARISSWAKGVGLKGNYAKQTGSGTPFGWTFANWVFFKKVRQALGLAECHFPMSGAAPMGQETLLYFMSINIPIHEIYGMSETTGPTTVTTTDRIRFKSSGRPFGGVDVKIDSPDESGAGEVLVRGRHVFMGYIGLPEKTCEVLDNQGWFRSGDVGYIDKEGYLYITGRRKELIITAGGEKIAPVPIENSIKHELPIVSQAMVIGDQQKYLSCLLTLKVETDHTTGLPEDQLTEVAVAECAKVGSNALTVSDILCNGGDSRVLRMIQGGIDRVNRRAMSRAQKIAKWSILERDFSIASGELTPTMKLKRRDIMLKFSDSIESFYNN